MSWFGRRERVEPAGTCDQPAGPPPPAPVTFYSAYLRRRPRSEEPRDAAGNLFAPYLWSHNRSEALSAAVRGRLALAIEANRVALTTDVHFKGRLMAAGEDLMAPVALETLVERWGDLSLRDAGYPRRDALNRLAAIILTDEDVSRALDVIGAWTEAFSRLPEAPWAADQESNFLTAVDDALTDTDFGVRGRDVVLRVDLGGAVLIEAPFRALVTARSDLRPIDEKLQEALAELDNRQTADAVTDAGTALQMLFEHLGFGGPALGDQIKAARKAQFFSGSDARLGSALEDVSYWIAATRNAHGDAHPGPAPDLRDAEFVVRMVGLMVLRLA